MDGSLHSHTDHKFLGFLGQISYLQVKQSLKGWIAESCLPAALLTAGQLIIQETGSLADSTGQCPEDSYDFSNHILEF